MGTSLREMRQPPAPDEGVGAGSERELRQLLRPEVKSGLIDRLERYLDLDRWGFRLTYVDPRHDKVVYASSACRVKATLLIDRREGDAVQLKYARSHAPDDVELLMEWQGERCFAWHNIMVAPYWEFLEGFSAGEAAEHLRARVRWPLHAAFSATELGGSLQGADWSVAQEGYLWQHNGERLFSLFDVRKPELWEEFRRFLREYYELLPDHPFIRRHLQMYGIPPWNVC